MSNSLRGKRISESYQSLVQVIEGSFYDGSGNPIVISAGGSGGSGFQGPQGFRGLQGFIGNDGPQGPLGYQGPVGSTGSIGNTGATGYGPQGAVGSQGPKGVQGPPGAGGGSGGSSLVSPRDSVSVGGTAAWNPTYKLLVIDPATTISGLDLFLPDTTGFSGGELYYLSFGGQMTSGTVVNQFTIRGYGASASGEGVLVSSFQSSFSPGDGFVFCWDSYTSMWRLF